MKIRELYVEPRRPSGRARPSACAGGASSRHPLRRPGRPSRSPSSRRGAAHPPRPAARRRPREPPAGRRDRAPDGRRPRPPVRSRPRHPHPRRLPGGADGRGDHGRGADPRGRRGRRRQGAERRPRLLLRSVEVSCLPALIPERIDVDVSSLHIYDVPTVADLRLPEGVRVTDTGRAGRSSPWPRRWPRKWSRRPRRPRGGAGGRHRAQAQGGEERGKGEEARQGQEVGPTGPPAARCLPMAADGSSLRGRGPRQPGPGVPGTRTISAIGSSRGWPSASTRRFRRAGPAQWPRRVARRAAPPGQAGQLHERERAAAGRLLRLLGADPAELVVVYDDLDLPFGTVRSAAGSHGGHNGMESVLTQRGHPGGPPGQDRGGAARRPRTRSWTGC